MRLRDLTPFRIYQLITIGLIAPPFVFFAWLSLFFRPTYHKNVPNGWTIINNSGRKITLRVGKDWREFTQPSYGDIPSLLSAEMASVPATNLGDHYEMPLPDGGQSSIEVRGHVELLIGDSDAEKPSHQLSWTDTDIPCTSKWGNEGSLWAISPAEGRTTEACLTTGKIFHITPWQSRDTDQQTAGFNCHSVGELAFIDGLSTVRF